jgi:hypothetical protein
LYIIHQERPVATILSLDTFYVLKNTELPKKTELDRFKGYPKILYVELPEDKVQAKVASVTRNIIGGALHLQSKYYRDIYDTDRTTESIFSIARELQHPHESCLAVRLESSYSNGIACYDTENNKLFAYLADPS